MLIGIIMTVMGVGVMVYAAHVIRLTVKLARIVF